MHNFYRDGPLKSRCPTHGHHCTNIRLLTLHPDQRTLPIRCSLNRACIFIDASKDPKYEALSYTWGDMSKTLPIILDGDPFQVTESLESALRHLRLEREPRTLWIDAICINQSDLEERSLQVPFMLETYGSAERVVVWLGEEKDGSAEAMSRIATGCLTASQSKMIQSRKHIPNQGDKHEALKIIPSQAQPRLSWGMFGSIFNSARPAVASRDLSSNGPTTSSQFFKTEEMSISQEELALLSRPYWTRIWVIQEIVLGREVIVTCGEHSVSWHHFTKAYAHIKSVTSMSIKSVLTGFQTINDIRRERQENAQSDNRDSHIELVKQFRHCGATDPRDKIFGLLGLLRHSPETAEHIESFGAADYKRSVFAVYRSFTLGELFRGNLDILSHVGTFNPRSGLPSWMPDWSMPLNISVLAKRQSKKIGPLGNSYSTKYNGALYHAAGTSKPQFAWDTWTDVYKNNHKAISFEGQLIDSVEVIGEVCTTSFNISVTSHEPIVRWKLLDADRMLFPPGYSTGRAKTLDFYRTLIADNGPDGRASERLPSLLVKYLDSPVLQQNSPNRTSSLEAWLLHLNSATFGRRYIITAEGFIGLAPAECKVGDKVVVLKGGQVPFVLRSDKGNWRFVGECYVHGIMDGEVMTTVHGKDVFRKDTNRKEKDFIMV